MVYSTQSYLVLLLFPSSSVLGSRNTTFQKLDLFPSSGEGEEKTPTQLGSLERSSFRNVVFLHPKTPDSEKSKKTQQLQVFSLLNFAPNI
jgi:hypothetical protein